MGCVYVLMFTNRSVYQYDAPADEMWDVSGLTHCIRSLTAPLI
jgi:hypothetical protein